MEKPLFAASYKHNQTTPARFEAAEERKAETYTEWKRLVDFHRQYEGAEQDFLLLAAQRATGANILEIANVIDMEPWEALASTYEAEAKLTCSAAFAGRFRRYLETFEDAGQREQAVTVQDGCAMTYEEIGERMGIAWQRVQQIEQQALAKLRGNPRLLRMLLEAR